LLLLGWLTILPVGAADSGSFSLRVEIQFHTVKINGRLDTARLMRMGVDRIILRVFENEPGREGGLLFFNSVFRVLNPVLEHAIAEFDRTDIDLFAWMITRKFSWLENTRLYDFEYDSGRKKQVPKLDVFNPEAVARIMKVYRELAAKDIQGILIQDDFFLRHNEGVSPWGKAAFIEGTGWTAREEDMLLKDTPKYRHWLGVKRGRINEVLRQIVSECKKVNPDLKVGMNVYYETPFFVRQAEAWYAHNLNDIVSSGIDYVYLMSYHRQMKREMGLTESENRALFQKILYRARSVCGDKLIPKFQIRDWQTGARIPWQEVRAYIDLLPAGTGRICLTPVKPGDEPYLEMVIGGRRPE
jgi:hypothetical protein